MSWRSAIRALGFACSNLVASCCFLLAHDAVAADRPNIIFILADDLGYGDLGCYGQKQIQTPRLDRMAAEGMRFTQAYSGSTVCAPSRCVLMTAKHTGHARVRGNERVPLEPDDFTVGEQLHLAGYHTAIIGKWGLGEPDTTGIPNKQGFDEWFGYLNQEHAHNYYPDYLWRNETKVLIDSNKDDLKGTYSHDLFVDEAEQFIRRRVSSDANTPFFLYLALTIPHTNNELGRRTGNGQEVPSDVPYSDREWPQPEKNFAAMITRMDNDIGRLLDLLRELNLDEKTIVFFTSDNGPHHEGGHSDKFFESSGGLRGSKRDLYEGGIRVPFIARWPGKIAAGSTCTQVISFADFLPTAGELGSIEPAYGIDGISFRTALLGQGERDPEFLYWEFHEGAFKQAVRMGNWKAVRLNQGLPLELYALDSDIAESHNVASSHPDVIERIELYLKTARTESPHWPKRR